MPNWNPLENSTVLVGIFEITAQKLTYNRFLNDNIDVRDLAAILFVPCQTVLGVNH